MADRSALILEAVDYDPDTGLLFWRERPVEHFATVGACTCWNSRLAGKSIARKIDRDGYAIFAIRGSYLKAHRVAWLCAHGAWPEGEIDHINGVRDDNRLCNLRVVDRSTNARNCKRRYNNRSGHVGVRRVSGASTWQAEIWFAGKNVHLGCFRTKAEAIEARKAAEAQYGFHPLHGRDGRTCYDSVRRTRRARA